LTCLGINHEHGEIIVASGATLVSSGVATGCANSKYQTERQQKTDGQVVEVEVPVDPLFFVFHYCSSLDFVAVIYRR